MELGLNSSDKQDSSPKFHTVLLQINLLGLPEDANRFSTALCLAVDKLANELGAEHGVQVVPA